MGELEEHPLAAIFPLMADADLNALAADIAANGQQEPVWLFEGQILDGRNRYRACVGRGLPPLVAEYAGDDPAGFVISKNLHRRHLTESQRAMVGGKIAANLQQKGRTVRAAVVEAARMVNVGERSVYSAMGVVSGGVPELAAAVETGEATVSAAAEVAKLPKAQQRQAVADRKVKEAAAGKRQEKKEETGGGPARSRAGRRPANAATGKTPPPPLKDGLGNVVPPCVADTFGDPMLADAVARINAAHAELVSIQKHVVGALNSKSAFWPYAQFGECAKSLTAAADRAAEASAQLSNGLPFRVCPKCDGEGCNGCRDAGYWTRHRHEERAQYGD